MDFLFGQSDRLGLRLVERGAQVLRGGLEGDFSIIMTGGLAQIRVKLRVRRGRSDGHVEGDVRFFFLLPN